MTLRWIEGALMATNTLARGRWLAYAVNSHMRVLRMVRFGYNEFSRFPEVDVEVSVLIGSAYALSQDLGDWESEFRSTLNSLQVDRLGNWTYWIPNERLQRTRSHNIVYLDPIQSGPQ